jgi:sporulation protein YlmC with PRC-barrel domain
MDIDTQASEPTVATPSRDADPHARLHVDMKVIGDQGKPLGKVATLTYDHQTGQLTELGVRHGMLRQTTTTVPARLVRQVNENAVLLDMSAAAFKRFVATAKL